MFILTSFREKALSSASQAGLVNTTPAVWGLGQLITGGLSDHMGRKPLIAGGMPTQAIAIGAIAATTGFRAWAGAAALLGAGTAMVYPQEVA